MFANKSPRRIDRKAGGRNKKVNVGQLTVKNDKSIKWKNQRKSSTLSKKKRKEKEEEKVHKIFKTFKEAKKNSLGTITGRIRAYYINTD